MSPNLEVLLGKPEVDGSAAVVVAGHFEGLGDGTGTTEVRSDLGLELGRAAWEVLASLDRLPHLAVDGHPVGTAEHRAGTEERERVVLRAGVVDGDVPKHALVNLLREVDVDAQEVRISLSSLDLLEQALEPTERWSITANPEELDTTERTAVAGALTIPDVLQDGGERRYTDTRSDQHRDLDVEDILGWGTEGTVEADSGETDLVGVDLHEVAAGCRLSRSSPSPSSQPKSWQRRPMGRRRDGHQERESSHRLDGCGRKRMGPSART